MIAMGKIRTTTWKIEPHTQAKLEILRKYLDAWIPILTSGHKVVNIVDGFAGPGEYEGGIEGSPLVAIRALREQRIAISAKVVFIFIENDKERYECLKENLNKTSIPSNAVVRPVLGDFAAVISSNLKSIKDKEMCLAPTFAFIDPFGFKVPFKIIGQILKNPHCEVLFTFMFEEINRFVDDPKLKSTYDSLFGTSDWVKVRGCKNPSERLRILHECYESQLRKAAKYVLSFKMINKSNKTDYFLFFATNSFDGLKRMKESMWKVDPIGKFEFSDANYDPAQQVLFGRAPNYAHLKDLILRRFKGKTANIEDVEEFVVAETPFRETHYKKAILKEMERSRDIVVSGTRKRKGTYPSGVSIQFI